MGRLKFADGSKTYYDQIWENKPVRFLGYLWPQGFDSSCSHDLGCKHEQVGFWNKSGDSNMKHMCIIVHMMSPMMPFSGG